MPNCVVKGCSNYDRKINKLNDDISYHQCVINISILIALETQIGISNLKKSQRPYIDKAVASAGLCAAVST